MTTLEKFLRKIELFPLFCCNYQISKNISTYIGAKESIKIFFERHGEDPEALECAINFHEFPKWSEINV